MVTEAEVFQILFYLANNSVYRVNLIDDRNYWVALLNHGDFRQVLKSLHYFFHVTISFMQQWVDLSLIN
jgi:hypothetical protein